MVIYLICAIISFLLGLFVKDYLPSYFNKKGENLATKEDIAEITALQEKVQDEFHKEFERFSSDVHFTYDFYYKQYTDLYSKLYSIIWRSEYMRSFFRLLKGVELSPEEVPFVEVSKKRIHESIQGGTYQRTEENQKDNITDFCRNV